MNLKNMIKNRVGVLNGLLEAAEKELDSLLAQLDEADVQWTEKNGTITIQGEYESVTYEIKTINPIRTGDTIQFRFTTFYNGASTREGDTYTLAKLLPVIANIEARKRL